MTSVRKPRSTKGARSVIGVSLTELARTHNLPYTTIKSRWYKGQRGEALVAPRAEHWDKIERLRAQRALRDRVSKPR